MKKLLFISNSTKPSIEQLMSNDMIKLDNVSIPSIEAAQSMGYEVYMGINRFNAEHLKSDYNVKFYNANIYRSIFDFKNNYKAYKNLMNLLKKENIDVIHCNTPIGGVLGRICGKKAKVSKIIYTVHGFHFYKGATLLNRTIFKWAEKLLAYYTDVIITINKEDYHAAQNFNFSGKVYHIPGVGIETALYRQADIDKHVLKSSLGFSDHDILLIAMGDLIHRKNYAASIKAIAKTANPNLHFLICGTGPKLDELKAIAKEMKIENQIHFLGFRTDIKQLQQIADIFLFTTYQEGLPRSMMEAMASGLPCVASNIRGNSDLIEDGIGGYLHIPEDIEGFAKSISKLAADERLRKEMGLKNLENIKQFDLASVKVKMSEIYRRELI